MSSLPPPSQLINAPKFQTWFPGQEELTLKLLSWFEGDKRFLCANVPTGFGKSVVAIVSGWLSGDKVVYITNTKGLQDQLMEDFKEPVGLVQIMGQNNYTCIDSPSNTVDRGKCHAGLTCAWKSECLYYSALDRARQGRIINTNYAYWLAQNCYSDGLLGKNDLGEVEGTYPLVIMDEAHSAGSALEQHLTVTLNNLDLDMLEWEPRDWDWPQWQLQAAFKHQELSYEIVELRKSLKLEINRPDLRQYLRRFQRLRSLVLRLDSLQRSQVEWIREWSTNSVSLCPIWPSTYNSRLLIGDKILLMSGTLTRKGVEKLGIMEEECEWIDSPSPFDPALSPIHHVETIRLTYNTPPENYKVWARRIDQIIEKRLDRKGILFTVSYARAQLFHRLSAHQDKLVLHDTWNVQDRVAEFKQMKAPAVLVSPTVTSGWDFPDSECEYIIIGKVPFVTATGELTKARQKNDSEWVHSLAMETIVQEAGRGTRSGTDRCEVFIVDDMWKWWYPKFKHFSPQWFQDRIGKSLDLVPEPREGGMHKKVGS
jgi:Rad3-related DNA helicase